MTLEQVMALDGRELDAAVAERLGWTCTVPHVGTGFPPGTTDNSIHNLSGFPDFSRDWSAAMRIRDWARGLSFEQQFVWCAAIADCLDARMGNRNSLVFVAQEPVDYARAALLVSVGG